MAEDSHYGPGAGTVKKGYFSMRYVRFLEQSEGRGFNSNIRAVVASNMVGGRLCYDRVSKCTADMTDR